jgi:integrase
MMFLVEMTVLEGRERVPLLYRSTPYQPLVVPLLYIAIRRRYQKSRTLLRDVRALRALYRWCEGVRRVPLDLDAHLSGGGTLSASDIEAFVRWLRIGRSRRRKSEESASVSTGVLKPVSLHNYVTPVRSFLLWSVQRYRPERGRGPKADALRDHTSLIDNTFDAVRIRGRTPELEKGMQQRELRELFDVAHPRHPDNPFRHRLRQRNALIVELFYQTGIRRGELLKLRVEDLLPDEDGNCFVRIHRRPDDPTDSRATEPGQKTDNRVLAIHPSLFDALVRYVREERRPRRQGRPMKLTHTFLFVSERGAPLAESQVNYVLGRLAKQCFRDRVKVHPHLLRNTFCNEFIDYCTEVEKLDEEGAKDRLRILCGWTAASAMPERYTRKRIQREANVFNIRRQQLALRSLAEVRATSGARGRPK